MILIKHLFTLYRAASVRGAASVCRTAIVAAASVILSGCGPAGTVLPLQLNWQQQTITCNNTLALPNGDWQLSQLQLYLSDFSLNGQPLPLKTAADLPWQQANLALLGGDCADKGQWQLHFARPLSDGTLSFTLGLPAPINHQDMLRAATPLNQSDMHWSWQQGYKFLRLELQNNTSHWALHLGSTGCNGASVMRPPSAACRQPNRVHVSLAYRSGQQLVLDLAALLHDFNPGSDNHCMADPLSLSCQLLLPRLGIGAPQQLWRVE
jgi:uncharacterized repeat protein (TIGR04052 family)